MSEWFYTPDMDSGGVERAVEGLMALASAGKRDRALVSKALLERISRITDPAERLLAWHRVAEFMREARPGLTAGRYATLNELHESEPDEWSHGKTARRLEVTRGNAQSIREGRGIDR